MALLQNPEFVLQFIYESLPNAPYSIPAFPDTSGTMNLLGHVTQAAEQLILQPGPCIVLGPMQNCQRIEPLGKWVKVVCKNEVQNAFKFQRGTLVIVPLS